MDEDSIQESIQELLSAIDINQISQLRKDHNGHPLLLEVERIISWLELFNVLLNGLIRLNGLLEKSHVCQEKLAYIIKKSREKKAHLLSITSNGQWRDRSKSRSRTSSESGEEVIIDPSVVDSLADKVASLLQMTSPRKASSKIKGPKISKPQLTSTQPNAVSNTVATVQSNAVDTSTFRRRHKTYKIKDHEIPSNVTKPKKIDVVSQAVNCNKEPASKLASWFVEFPEDRKIQGKLRVKVMKDAPEKLPQIFEKKCKHLKERSEKRAELINTKAMVRKFTQEERLRKAVAECVRENREREARRDEGLKWSESTPYDYSVKNGIKMKRIFTHKQMRDQTERMYQKLPEVVQKEKEMKREESKRVHRVMKHVFNHQMKRSVSHGRLNFPITQNFTVY